jgi:hypothetical protein
MRELFIYYRVHHEHHAALRDAVLRWHAQLMQRYPALKTRLLHRAESPLDTWMEIFSTDPTLAPQGVDEAMQASIEAGAEAFGPWISGPRHLEVFFSCAS